MIVFRLSKTIYSKDLSGKGAEKSGGRWNSRGVAMLYTSQSRALCTTEIAVHTPLGVLPKDFQIVTIELPDFIKIKEVKLNSLPKDWKMFPHSHTTQIIGDQFINELNFLVLKVPSVVVEGEFNFLINPKHKDFQRVKINSVSPFNFDSRLFLK
jgi:RES domain-containing protein